MAEWQSISGFLEACAVYITMQLVRCAAFSVILAVLVMLLRKLCANYIFVKGMLWAFLLFLPFLGRLRMFYENEAVFSQTWWLTAVTMQFVWFDWIYMAGVFVSMIWIFGKWFRLRRIVGKMKIKEVCGQDISISEWSVTPFTVGLLKPRIVLPQILIDHDSAEELEAILRHERTHIRLGHLWFYLFWDVLRCLLWVNPLFIVCQKYFREDMEDICDRVCIQNSGSPAREYGIMLLQNTGRLNGSLSGEGRLSDHRKITRSGSGPMPPAVSYAGENDFEKMKRRIGRIAGFRPYRRRQCAGIAVVLAVWMIAAAAAIWHGSYPRCSELDQVLVHDGAGRLLSQDMERLEKIISYDDRFVYVDREAFEQLLRENQADTGDGIFIVFGGFQKLPGVGGNADSCQYPGDVEDGDGTMVRIPYEKRKDSLAVALYKML